MRLSPIEKNIAFVSHDECLINHQLIRKRAQLIAAHRELLEIAGNLHLQYQKLCSLEVIDGKLPANIETMLHESNLTSTKLRQQIPNSYEGFRTKEELGKAGFK